MWHVRAMWSLTQKVTFDPKSGKPEAPMYWRLTTFFVITAWVMAVILGSYAALALRDHVPGLAVVCALSAIVLLLVVHRRKAQIRKEQLEFDKLVADYQNAISKPLF